MSKKEQRNEQIVSAPGPLTIGEDTYMVGKPTAADIWTMRAWIRRNAHKAIASESVGLSSEELNQLTPEDRKLFLIEMAKARANAKKEMTPDQMLDLVQSPDGVAQMVWISARRFDPSVKLEKIRAAITEDNVDQVLAEFNEISGVKGENGNDDPKAPGPVS